MNSEQDPRFTAHEHPGQRAARSDRSGALVNGALIAIGTLGVIDNVVVHWLLRLHRAVPGPWATEVEIALVVLSLGLLLVGLGREIRARRGLRHPEVPMR